MHAAEPEPRPIRVTLVPLPGERPGVPAAAARGIPDAPAPAAKSLPAPARVVAKPKPKPPAPKPPPKPVVTEVEPAAPQTAPAVGAAPASVAPSPDAPGEAEGGAAGAGVPEGRGSGAGAGSAAEGDGGASRDRIAQYVEDVRRRIAGLQRYPAAAKLRGVEGVVTVVLAIAPDGRLVDLVLEGDPNVLLARSAREATEAAAPFAPPPGGARRIRVPVRYALR